MAAILGPDPTPPGPSKSAPRRSRGWLYGILAGVFVGGAAVAVAGAMMSGEDGEAQQSAHLSVTEGPVSTVPAPEGSLAGDPKAPASDDSAAASSGPVASPAANAPAPGTPPATTATTAPKAPASAIPGTTTTGPTSSRRVCTDGSLDYPSPDLSGKTLDQSRTALAVYANNKASLIEASLCQGLVSGVDEARGTSPRVRGVRSGVGSGSDLSEVPVFRV